MNIHSYSYQKEVQYPNKPCITRKQHSIPDKYITIINIVWRTITRYEIQGRYDIFFVFIMEYLFIKNII